jgi:class 3 adenylate cyclase
MPVIRIDLPEGTPRATKTAVRNGVKAAVLRTLAPKETKYDYVAIAAKLCPFSAGLQICVSADVTSAAADHLPSEVATNVSSPSR